MHTGTRIVAPAAHDSVSTGGSSRAGRQQLIAWLALSLTVGLVVVIYMALSLAVSADPVLMPLDDTYIHFQYARQLAHGEPLIYNPGDPATSGATSLLYPLLLAGGYTLGFSAWSLAYWALGIGTLCFLGAVWLVYLIARRSPLDPRAESRPGYALGMAVAFALSGPFIWAALSGMETTLFIFTVLLTLYALQYDKFRLAILAAALMALTRPEGLLLAGVAMLALALQLSWLHRAQRAAWLVVPVLAGLIQPVINALVTDGPTSSGMLAKSHVYNSSAPPSDRLRAILEFFERMWRELLSGRSPHSGTYTSPVLAEAALAALLIGTWLAWRSRRMNVCVVALVWIVTLTAAVATLDTAFWQFKRYQLPVMALFFPAAAWISAGLGDVFTRRFGLGWASWGLPVLILIPAVFTTFTFARNYAENVTVVRDQQLPMARWVTGNLPADIRIGVHDVGLMRYFGDRALYDVVGLTTPGPAQSWRQGPGAIYEHMAASEYRPDFFAIYPDVQGLPYLVSAGVFGEVLAEFPVDLPPHNVAAATGLQAVYRADWSNTRAQEMVAQTTTLDTIDGFELVDQVDVANLADEAGHHYRWWQADTPSGFVTEVYRLDYLACGLSETGCWATDGGRVLTGGEEFTLKTTPGKDLLLVTRVQGRSSVSLNVSVNGQRVGQRVQPEVPGRWIEIVTLVPGDQITGEETRVRIAVESAGGVYSPYYHWAYQGLYSPQMAGAGDPVAVFGEEGSIRLLDYAISQLPGQIDVTLTWLGPASGDGVVFVHLYNHSNVNIEPVVQAVSRPAGGVLPPGNWLPGVFQDTYTLYLHDDVPPGTYVIAMGLFEARTGERYPVTGSGADDASRRLYIGEITIRE